MKKKDRYKYMILFGSFLGLIFLATAIYFFLEKSYWWGALGLFLGAVFLIPMIFGFKEDELKKEEDFMKEDEEDEEE